MRIGIRKRKKRYLFYKKRKNYKSKIILISIVFFVGLAGGSYGLNSYKSIILSKNEESVSMAKVDNNINDKEVKAYSEEMELNILEQEKSILSNEEISLIKEATKNDKNQLFKLVNKENVLEDDFKPDNLVVPNVNLQQDLYNEQSYVREEMVEDLEAMFNDANKAGFEIFLNSGFRSFSLQNYLYKAELEKNETNFSDLVAMPGASEHQLGYAVDITSKNVNFTLVQAFEDTEEGKWLINNAHKYGFILRYGKEKEEITGYRYEPWHYRYIGNKEISKICYEKNLTLEELYDLIKSK